VLARPRLDTERLGLHVETATCSAPLDGDPTLIERLVANLGGGHVEVSTSVKEGQAVLSVTNTGPVVPPSELNRLFEPFQRLDGRRTRHKDGHGLGLSIVRAIATAHGAAVSASALPGGGLSVDVAFPAPRGPSPAADRGLRAYSTPVGSKAGAR
jgi:signal transduction histidine kinase